MKIKKLLTSIIAGCMTVMFVASCEDAKVNESEPVTTVTTVSVEDLSYTSAICEIEVTGETTECGVCWSTDPTPTVESFKKVCGDKAGKFTVSITDLLAGTKYYVRAYAVVGNSVVYGAQKDIRTLDAVAPVVEIAAPTNVQARQAMLKGTVVIPGGGMTITEMGICYSTSPEPAPTVEDNKVTTDSRNAGNYIITVTGLADATQYFARAYFIIGNEITYSANTIDFTTPEDLPVCSTPVLTKAVEGEMTVSAQAIQSGDRAVLSWGVCWSTEPNPTIEGNKVEFGTSPDGPKTETLTGLPVSDATNIFVRTYATTAISTSYGLETSLRTVSVPVVEIAAAVADVQARRATFTGTLAAKAEGMVITEMGICYSTSAESAPTVEDNKVTTDSRTVGKYVLTAMELADAAKYFARAYAIAGNKAYYSEVTAEFTTPEDFPVCSTPVLTDPLVTTMTASAQATQSGDREILSWGVCWGTVSNPSIEDNKVEFGTSGGGSETKTLTGLPELSEIFVRTYATTAISTTYGPEVSERTISILAEVSTGTVSASTIFKYSAVMAGSEIISLGLQSLPILKAGVCFSWTNPLPTIGDKTIEQTKLEVGAMDDMKITIVPPGTKVYVRAFATNEGGTSYGNVVEFTTAPENFFIPDDASTTGPPDPKFNGLRFYYLQGGSGTPTANMGPWQVEQLNAYNAGFNGAEGRKLDYIAFLFTSNKATPEIAPTAGTEKYVTVRIYYRNAANTSYVAYYDLKVHIDEMGLYTFSELRLQTGVAQYNSYNTLKTWSTIRPELEKFEAYLTGHQFMLEFESLSVVTQYHLIPVDEPAHYFKMSMVRYTGLAYMPAW